MRMQSQRPLTCYPSALLSLLARPKTACLLKHRQAVAQTANRNQNRAPRCSQGQDDISLRSLQQTMTDGFNRMDTKFDSMKTQFDHLAGDFADFKGLATEEVSRNFLTQRAGSNFAEGRNLDSIDAACKLAVGLFSGEQGVCMTKASFARVSAATGKRTPLSAQSAAAAAAAKTSDAQQASEAEARRKEGAVQAPTMVAGAIHRVTSEEAEIGPCTLGSGSELERSGLAQASPSATKDLCDTVASDAAKGQLASGAAAGGSPRTADLSWRAAKIQELWQNAREADIPSKLLRACLACYARATLRAVSELRQYLLQGSDSSSAEEEIGLIIEQNMDLQTKTAEAAQARASAVNRIIDNLHNLLETVDFDVPGMMDKVYILLQELIEAACLESTDGVPVDPWLAVRLKGLRDFAVGMSSKEGLLKDRAVQRACMHMLLIAALGDTSLDVLELDATGMVGILENNGDLYLYIEVVEIKYKGNGYEQLLVRARFYDWLIRTVLGPDFDELCPKSSMHGTLCMVAARDADIFDKPATIAGGAVTVRRHRKGKQLYRGSSDLGSSGRGSGRNELHCMRVVVRL